MQLQKTVAESATKRILRPLASGSAAIVNSDIGGISCSATDATGGEPPYTYQWQRRAGDSTFSNLSDGHDVFGTTTRILFDGTVVPGRLYSYRIVYSDTSDKSVTSNVVSARVGLLLLFLWDADARRYVSNRTKRRVSDRAIKQAMNTLGVRAGRELRTMTRSVLVGELSVPEWQRQFSEFVKALVLMMYAVALGGWAQLSAADLRHASGTVRFHLEKLVAFARDLSVGRKSSATVLSRSQLYAAAMAGVLEDARVWGWRETAAETAVEMRNILGHADHCTEKITPGTGRPGCIEETDRGWVPYGEMSSPGRRICLVHCKCRLSIRVRPETRTVR